MERPKLKLLALHSFRTSADIFKEQVCTASGSGCQIFLA